MDTTRRTRTTGLGRILATGLILSALLAAFPGSAQAAPAPRDGAPLAGLMSWLEGLLADLGFQPVASQDGPKAAVLPDSSSIDPIGGNSSQGLKASRPSAQGLDSGLSDPPATK